jgi:hypothetical protein
MSMGMSRWGDLVGASPPKVTGAHHVAGSYTEKTGYGSSRRGGRGNWRNAFAVVNVDFANGLGHLGLPDNTICRKQLSFGALEKVISSAERSLALLSLVL